MSIVQQAIMTAASAIGLGYLAMALALQPTTTTVQKMNTHEREDGNEPHEHG